MALDTELDLGDFEYDENSVSQARSDGPTTEESPACLSCRKKKSRCSREQPCSQCVKSGVECTYEDRRLKGGIKTGVIERLNQRIDTLENMFMGQSILVRQFMQDKSDVRADSLTRHDQPPENDQRTSFRSYTDKIKDTLLSLPQGGGRFHEQAQEVRVLPTKRKAQSDPTSPAKRPLLVPPPIGDLCAINPLVRELDDIMVVYFKVVHPWVPVLHPATFMKRARETVRAESVNTILKAIVAVATKYAIKQGAERSEELINYSKECRRNVILTSVEDASVEALQAMHLIAFDTINSGGSASPWSLVSLICRKVEDLQLNLEDAVNRESCARFFVAEPVKVRENDTWLEAERKRRAFWISFLFDRFSSIVTGISPAISSKAIRRRLPCEGLLWESVQAVETSYFQVDSQPDDEANLTGETSLFTSSYVAREGSNALGGLAFTIEATELLSTIKKFHLRNPLHPGNANQLAAWLNKFRQLDAGLMLWELHLTQRWREVRVVNGYIDPNLTLAHMTHSAAIITLHHALAFPPPQSRPWLSGLVLAASREACLSAALKIDQISRKYLSASDGIAPHQFAYCLFVAGQVLLEASDPSSRPHKAVDYVISSLKEVSTRIAPSVHEQTSGTESPAARFAIYLTEQRERDLVFNQPEESGSKPQHATPFPAPPTMQNSGDITGLLAHCEMSPSSGISPISFVPCVQNDSLTDSNQYSLPGPRGPMCPVPVSSFALRQTGLEGNGFLVGQGRRELDFIADFWNPEMVGRTL